MHVLLLELADGHLNGLPGIVIVMKLLDTCLHIKQEVFLDDVVNNIQKGLVLAEDGGLIQGEWRTGVVH
jgi:hypothetical protein